MLLSARRIAMIYTSGKPNNLWLSECHNTEEPTLQARTMHSIYTYRPVATLSVVLISVITQRSANVFAVVTLSCGAEKQASNFITLLPTGPT
ncbi:hypothetical protein ACER0C_018202 [Sarotherodon galilaeus]